MTKTTKTRKRTTSPPADETSSPAQTQAERDLLAHYEKTGGVKLTRQQANVILTEARALGDV